MSTPHRLRKRIRATSENMSLEEDFFNLKFQEIYQRLNIVEKGLNSGNKVDVQEMTFHE